MQHTVLWLTVANVLYIISYAVRDILWLRILSVAAAICLIPFYAFQPSPLEDAILWNLVFIAINAYWIARLIFERRPVHFTPDEERLKLISFPSLTPQETRALYSFGRWDDVNAGDSLVQHDKIYDETTVILRGVAEVVHRGITIGELGEGQYVGTIVECADQLKMDVTAHSALRVMCWPQKQLGTFLAERPDVALTLQRSIGLELSRILNSTLSDLGSKTTIERGTT